MSSEYSVIYYEPNKMRVVEMIPQRLVNSPFGVLPVLSLNARELDATSVKTLRDTFLEVRNSLQTPNLLRYYFQSGFFQLISPWRFITAVDQPNQRGVISNLMMWMFPVHCRFLHKVQFVAESRAKTLIVCSLGNLQAEDRTAQTTEQQVSRIAHKTGI